MASIRQIADCIGLGGDLSIIRDFFGYWNRFIGPLSLLDQVRLVQGPHIHLNLIRVAIDGGEWKLPDDEFQLDALVQRTRKIYATVGLGIGRVQRSFIPAAESGGHEHLANKGDDELLKEFAVPNDGVDVFCVLTLGGAIGFSSDINGTCDKNDKGAQGVVIAMHQVGQDALAHEVGHWLGLEHVDDDNNLMSPAGNETDLLTQDQGDIMRNHCSVQPGC